MSVSNDKDNAISLYESYILSGNKEAFLRTLVPNSAAHKLLQTVHELNAKGTSGINPDAVRILDELTKYSPAVGSDMYSVLARYLLMKLENEKNPQEIKRIIEKLDQISLKEISKLKGYNKPVIFAAGDEFKEEKENQLASDLSTADKTLYVFEEFLKKVYNEPHLIKNTATAAIFPHLDMKKLAESDVDVAEFVLSNSENFAALKNVDGAVNAITKHYKKTNAHYAISDHYYDRMTLTQLTAVGKSLSGAKSNISYNKNLYLKTFDIDWDQIKSAEEVSLKLATIIAWVDKNMESSLAEDFTSFLRFALLANNLKLKKFDTDLFKKYLKRPLDGHSELNSDFRNEYYKNRKHANQHYWSSNMGLPKSLTNFSSSQLFEKYITYMLKFEEKTEWLAKYFDSKYLQRRSIIVELETGHEPKDMGLFFTENEMTQLRDQKYLQIEEHTKKRFEQDEKVEIFLKVKNISNLTVKTFEVNVQSYYRKYKCQFKDSIDLDGLIPKSTSIVDLSHVSPLTAISRGFEFPEIQQKTRGIFIIEFVGGGLSSRAIVRKGGLTLINQPIAKGIVFNVVNELKEICTGEGTSILVGGQLYQADKNGDIVIPYSTKSLNEDAIVIYKDFADIVPVVVPSENYAFLTSLIFNEESLVAGNTAKLIVHPKLIFNGRAISITYVKDGKITVNSTNDSGVKSSVVYPNINYSYEDDVVINYVVPPKLKKVEVVSEGVITLVDGTELRVSTNEFIVFEKKDTSDIYFDIYLQKTQSAGHVIRLLGKNGEPLPGKILTVRLHSPYIQSSKRLSMEVKTDEKGTVKLGKLTEVNQIDVEFNSSGLPVCSWAINESKDEMHIQNSYHICNGEELILPSMGEELSRNTHLLTEISKKDRRLLDDAFSCLQKQGNSLVLKFNKPGLYIFKYLNLDQTIEITVIEGQRWKFSRNFIVEPQQLTKMISDLSYMTIEEWNLKDSLLSIKINSNNASKLKLHLLGFTFYPSHYGRLHNVGRKMCPHYARETFGFPYTENSFMSEKLLSDEVNYVLTRKTKQAYVGNTLDKPTSLLKRHFTRETNPDQERLQDGANFKNQNLAENKGAFMKAEKAKLSMPPPRSFVVKRISEFLTSEGIVLENVKPDETGWFKIKLPNIEHLSTLRIVASDVMSNVSFDIPLSLGETKLSDVRLSDSKKTGHVYASNRFAQIGTQGQSVTVTDNANTDSIIVDSLDTAFEILKILNQYSRDSNSVELNKWSFLTKWSTLTTEQKLKKYDEYMSHELHVFLFFKDRSFFDLYVRKFITSKSKFDKLDYLFLGNAEEVKKMLTIKNFGGLKPIELVMFAYFYRDKEPQLCSQLIAALETSLAVNTIGRDETLYRQYFDTVLSHQVDESTKSKVQRMDEEAPLRRPLERNLPGNAKGGAPMMKATGALANIRRRDSREMMYDAGTDDARPAVPKRAIYTATNEMEVERAMSICASIASPNYSDDDAASRSADSRAPPKKADKGPAKKRLRASSIRRRSVDRSASFDSVMHDIKRTPASPQYIANAAIIEDNPIVDAKIVVSQKKNETTKEYIERDYFYNTGADQINAFWVNAVKAAVEKGEGLINLDHSFILCAGSVGEIILTLSLLSLGFEKASYTVRREGTSLIIDCSTGSFLQFCKQLNDKSAGHQEMDIIVSQRFFDPKDKFIYDETNPNLSSLKKVTEFLVGKIYTSRVAITNSGESAAELDLVCEIPQGSIPVRSLEYTQTKQLKLKPLETLTHEFSFYFPASGSFTVFPATVSKNNLLVAHASLTHDLNVVVKKSKRGTMDSISEIMISGSKKDILAYMETKNLNNRNIFKFEEVYWLYKDEAFYKQVIEILRRRFIFDQTTWAFSVFHGLKKEYFEYLDLSKRDFGIKFLKLPSLMLDNFQIKDYCPLTNPRAHNIGNKKHNLANKEFKETYLEFMKYCFEKFELDNRDRLTLCSYLTLQDRVEEALTQMAGIVRDRQNENEEFKIQLDYLTAYLSIYTEYPTYSTAKALSQSYATHHVETWRKRFAKIDSQIKETEGEASTMDQETNVEEVRISKSEQLKVEIKDQNIQVTSRNVSSVTISYYEIDIEILFSRDPFFNKDFTNSFNDVLPTFREVKTIDSGADETLQTFSIPSTLVTKNLVVYVQTAILSEKVRFVPTELGIVISSDNGFLKVTESKTKKPLPQVYVKTFALGFDDSVSFYKDGYTDMRGVFDYTSLNENKLDNINKLAVLIVSPTLGAITRIVSKPSRLGILADAIQLKSNSPQREIY